MPYEILHFRGSGDIIRKKRMKNDVRATLDFIDQTLQGMLSKAFLLKFALDEMDWRSAGALSIIDGRRYQYKGFKRGVAIEGNFASYEYILEGLFRIQIGFDKGIVETGILLLTSERSENSKLGTSADLAKAEIEALYPTINCPVSIALFDFEAPASLEDYEDIKGGAQNGVSIPPQKKEIGDKESDRKDPQPDQQIADHQKSIPPKAAAF